MIIVTTTFGGTHEFETNEEAAKFCHEQHLASLRATTAPEPRVSQAGAKFLVDELTGRCVECGARRVFCKCTPLNPPPSDPAKTPPLPGTVKPDHGTQSGTDQPPAVERVTEEPRAGLAKGAVSESTVGDGGPPSAPVTVATGGVPTGYRLGAGWTMGPWGLAKVGDFGCTNNTDPEPGHTHVALFGRFLSGEGACAACAIKMGALVPIDTARSPVEPGCQGRECSDGLTCATCKAVPEAAWLAWKTARPVPPGPVPVEDDGVCECVDECHCDYDDRLRGRHIAWCTDCRHYHAYGTVPDCHAAPASEPGVRPLSEVVLDSIEEHFDLPADAALVVGWAGDIRALEAELAEAKRTIEAAHVATARAEMEQLRGKLAEAEENVERVAARSKEIFTEAQADETKYQTEIKRLTKERVDIGNRYDLHMADCQRRQDETRGKHEREATARVRSMREAAVGGWEPLQDQVLDLMRQFKGGSEENRALSAIYAGIVNRLDVIRALPLDTGTATDARGEAGK
jgi:hypothetical protein